MPKKAKYKPLAKSKNNTSGKPSEAKREAELRAKAKKKGKPLPAKVKKISPGYKMTLSGLNPNKARQLPETPLSARGLTLRKLLRNTPRLFLHNSQDVHMESFKETRTRSGMPAISAVAFTADPFRPNKTKRPHKVFVLGLDKLPSNDPDTTTPINRHKKVIVSCDCEAFVYGGAEYANAAHGAARIVYGNGKPPIMTNPKLAYFLCKHLVAVAQIMIKRDL